MKNQTNEFGYDEVVETFSRSILLVREFVKALADGVQVTDALVIWKQYPNMEHLVQNAKTFRKQFLDLNAEESAAAYAEISKRTGEPELGIDRVALKSLKIATKIQNLIEESEEVFYDFKDLFAKKAA